jgi:glycosyltransferase involved in cell wall biosynthesis
VKVVLLALNARGVMAQYLDALAPELARHVDLTVVAPQHYAASADISVLVSGFAGPRSRAARAVMLANPLGASAVWTPVAAARPDVVHLLNGSDLPWGAVLARRARDAGIATIATIHSPRHNPGNPWWPAHSAVRRVTSRALTAFHVHAEVWRRLLVKRGIDERLIHVVPIGNLGPRFAEHTTPGGVPREPLALFFGRLKRYKGVERLVRATPMFPDGMRTAIVGQGRLSRRARDIVNRHPDRFELHLGYQPDDVLAHLLQRASVCVLPYTHATQSASPLIAACLGVPVVASAVGAFVEDVPRVNGVLVPRRGARSLARGVAEAVGRKPVCPPELGYGPLAKRFADVYARVLESSS